ncbi:MAG: hypothetical protein ACOYMF_00005, partial [Bacteroidales bacterium]
MKRCYFLIALAFILASIANAQVAINTDGSLPDNSAMLDVKSTTKGMLFPRMTMTQRNAIVSPAAGLTVFQTDNIPGIYYNSGSSVSPVWVMSGSGSWWSLTGNNGTNTSSNFIGTTDDVDLLFKRNNVKAGQLGMNNTSFGVNALNAVTTGIVNTAIGQAALNFNSTGNNNIAIGSQALYTNTTGSNNTASGVM